MHFASLGQAGAFQGGGQTKINKHNAAIGAQHDIGGLEVAMTQLDAMNGYQRRADLQEHIDAVAHRHQVANAQFQTAGRKIFCDQIVRVFGVAPIVDIDHGAVFDPHQQLTLPVKAESLFGRYGFAITVAKHLDGYVMIQFIGVGQVHSRMWRAGNRLYEAISGDDREARAANFSHGNFVMLVSDIHQP